MIKSVYILNRSGGLVFQKDFDKDLNQLEQNDYLVLASTFHSIHALATSISPLAGSSGIKVIEAPSFNMHCFQSLTGIKMLAVTDRHQRQVDQALNQIHTLYSDYVAKNPFYSLEMPIRCDKFDRKLAAYISNI